MQTSLTVKLKVNLLKGHMPENLAPFKNTVSLMKHEKVL